MITILRSNGSIVKTSPGTVKTTHRSFKGWSCAVGAESISINARGETWGSVCKEGGSLGNVFDRSLTLPKKAIICSRQACHCSSDLKILKGRSPSDAVDLLSRLHENADICNDISDAVAMTRTLPNSTRPFIIDWNIGNRCNYACSYCSPNQHNNSSPHLKYQKFCDALDYIKSLINNRRLLLTFIGGEPTLNPRYLDMCLYASPNSTIVTTTNGTPHVDKLIRAIQYGGMTISIHLQFYDAPKMISKIRSIVSSMPESAFLNIAFMMPPGQSHQFLLFRDALPLHSSLNIEAVPIYNYSTFELLHYSEEEKLLFSDN